MGQKAQELTERLLDSGSVTESGRVTTIHVGRDIYEASILIKLTKVL